jgi:hypothetical protein
MKNKLLLLLLGLLPLLSIAQNEDLELWSSVKFSKKINTKLRFELEEQVRWADSISVYKKNYTDIGFRYKPYKMHSLSASLRLINKAENDKHLRVHIDISSDFEIKKLFLILKQRIRFQQSWDELGEYDKTYFRSKWGVEMKKNFINPYIAHEFYWKLDQQTNLDQQRSTIGIAWNMSEDIKTKLFLRKQNEINKKNPDKLSIIGIGVRYKF